MSFNKWGPHMTEHLDPLSIAREHNAVLYEHNTLLLGRVAELETALREIAEWNDDFRSRSSVRHGDVGVREFARRVLGALPEPSEGETR